MKMRFKSILMLIVCICLTTIIYCILVSDPKRSGLALDSINAQLRHLKGVVIRDQTIHSIHNIFIFNNNHNYNHNHINAQPNTHTISGHNEDIDSEENERKCGQYLRVLGLWRNGSTDEGAGSLSDDQLAAVWPVFVTGISAEQYDVGKGFLRSFQEFTTNYNNNYSLIVYDLGLNRRQLLAISRICNESQTPNLTRSDTSAPHQQLNTAASSKAPQGVGAGVSQTSWCTIRRFDYDLFPAHVSDLKLYAYRPLILQLVLNSLGAAVWLDPNYYVMAGAAAVSSKVHRLTDRARRESGVLSWTIEQPTSSLTHPKMFDYFKTHQNQYYFHRMVKPSHIVLYNTRKIHEQLMLPWVKCALTPECLSPIGSQASGCRFDKKPLYRYSGCHHYDTSALNIVLGQMFDFNEKPYAAPEEDKFFRLVTIADDQIYTDDDITADTDYGVQSSAGYGVGSARVGRNHSL